MKILFKGLLLAFLCASCAGESGYVIDGTVSNLEEGSKIYLLQLDENNQFAPTDTTAVKNRSFAFKNPAITSSEISRLAFENKREGVIFVSENGGINVKVNGDSIADSEVRGGAENEYFTAYFDEMKATQKELTTLNQEGQQAWQNSDTAQVEGIRNAMENIQKNSSKKKLNLVSKNPDSPISLIILGDLLNGSSITPDEAEAAFDSLNPELQETKRGKQISEYIAKLKEQEIAAALAEIGNQAPAFSAPTPHGKTLALNDVLGKYTIIDFWASWCRPCRQENPNVVAVYEDYHDKGLNIISVSLDRPDSKEKWIAAIEQDNMDWHHVSNLKFWQDPIAQKYGVASIPATFLLDENGKIIDKNLRGPALRQKMEELLGNDAS
ncbi:MAG: TlpA disulfide reductase family protein [Leeuwenhoekiella sp.]